MPFVSEAQRRACWAKYHRDITKGIEPKWDCHKWERETRKRKGHMPRPPLSAQELLKIKDLNWKWIREAGKEHWLATTWKKFYKCDPEFVNTSCEVTASAIRWALNLSADPEWILINDERDLGKILKKHPVLQVTLGRGKDGWESSEHTLVIIGNDVLQSYYKKYPLRVYKLTPKIINAIQHPNNSKNYELITGVKIVPPTDLQPFYWIPTSIPPAMESAIPELTSSQIEQILQKPLPQLSPFQIEHLLQIKEHMPQDNKIIRLATEDLRSYSSDDLELIAEYIGISIDGKKELASEIAKSIYRNEDTIGLFRH